MISRARPRAWFCMLGVFIATPGSAQVFINEVLSANQTGLVDEDGDHEDWIELYNVGPDPVDLLGFGLSDDGSQPYKWTFPDIVLEPDSHLVVFASDKDRSVSGRPWATVIDQGDLWRYRPGTSEPPAEWATLGFDDGSWSEGPSGFGFGDGDDTTIVDAVMSVHVRTRFMIDDLSAITGAVLHVDYDDGFVAYLNGVEIARANIGVPGTPPPFDQPAHYRAEAVIYQGGVPGFWVIDDLSLFRPGENVLALQVHNVEASTDLTLIPFLTLGYVRPPEGGAPDLAPLLAGALPGLHANFELAAGGETIALRRPDMTVADEIVCGALPFDVSFGREPDGSSILFLFDPPTPGSANAGAPLDGIADPPDATMPPGFYAGGVVTELTASSPDAIIRYTLDATEPGPDSPTFEEPIAIASTTVVRARAFEAGKLPSPIMTRTYFVDETIDLPVISLVTDPPNLWDDEIGIYAFGDDYDPEFPYYGANFWEDWERPVHFEWFEEDGELAARIDAGVKIHGNWSRGLPQKSLRVIARGGYGAESIDHRIFPEKEIGSFKSLVLRNAGNDWNTTHIRDVVMQRATRGFGLDRQAYRPAVVFLNGAYWGIHNVCERQDEHYLASNHGVDPEGVDILEYGGDVITGEAYDYWAMLDFIEAYGLADDENLAWVRTRMDVENFATYCAFEIYYTNTDWPGNNIEFWRPQTPGGRWRWLLFDLDFGLGLIEHYTHNTLAFALADDGPSWPNPPWSTFLLRSLMENAGFRRSFINRYADLMNSALTPSALRAEVDSVRAMIESEMPRHLARWEWGYPDWLHNLDVMTAFIDERPAFARAHVIEEFGLAGDYELALDVAPPGMGSIGLTTIRIDSTWSGRYFRGNPVTLTAIPKAGYRFTGWSDGALPQETTVEIDPAGDYAVTALFEEAPPGPVVINEINYNSAPEFDPEDWVELYNAGEGAVDVSGWIFRDAEDAHGFVVPEGTVMPGGGYLVLSRDVVAFTALFPEVAGVFGDLGFGLSGDGELLRLYDATSTLIDSVRYDDEAPWPLDPDGGGPTLELINVWQDNALPTNWAASLDHGTPGSENSVADQVGIADVSGTPPAFIFLRPAPNPFTSRTRLRFAVPASGRVAVTVFDVSGRAVGRLLDGVLDAGWHTVTWNAAGVASGVYYARIGAGDGHRARKLVVVK